MPCLALEHFPPVPFEVSGLRRPVRVLGRPDRLAMMTEQGLLKALGAVRLIGDSRAQFLVRPISLLCSFAFQRASILSTSSTVAAVPATSRIDTW